MAEKQESLISSQQILLILRRRWRIFLFVFLIVMGGVSLWTFTQTRLYRPQVTLEIRPEETVVSTKDDPTATSTLWETYYKTQENILTSPSLVEQCLKALPESVRRDYESETDPVAELTDDIDIEIVRSSFVMKVGVIHEDPEMASQIANMLVSLFLEDTDRRMRDVKTDAVESLSKDTLPGMRVEMDLAEKNVEAFKKACNYIDLEEQYKGLTASWTKVLSAQEDVRLRKISIVAKLEALARYKSDGTGAELNPTLQETRVMERLSQDRDKVLVALASEQLKHKDQHPSVMALRAQLTIIEGKMSAAVEGALLALETDLLAATREEKAMDDEMKALQVQMGSADAQLTEYKKLDEELTGAKEVYASYLKRHGEESATAGSGVSSVRIIDPAVPPKEPYRPDIPVYLGLGGLSGLLLGAASMLLAEQLDNRILSAEEIEVFVALEVLSVIPRLSNASMEAPALLGNSATIPEIESFRGLRAEILTRFEKIPGGKALAILSALPSEGKSTVTLNLAKVMAMEGKRVLVIDADMRLPKLQEFKAKRGGPGLDAVLEGRVSLEEAAEPSAIPGVDIVGMEEGKAGAAELAGLATFDDLMRTAREKWDFVILDNAPVLMASESPLIARRADAAILVVREAKTGRNVAKAASRRLKGMGVRLLGAVLNCASPLGAGYGYGGGYGYGYGYGAESKGTKAKKS